MVKRLSKIRFLLHNHTLLKNIFNPSVDIAEKSEQDSNYKSNRRLNYKFDCTNPRSFNEYLCWIKHNYRNDVWKQCADKLGAKKFLIDNGFEKYVIKTIKIYNNTSEINLDELPNEFMLKTNSDSGSVFRCNKHTTNFEQVFAELEKSLNQNYGTIKKEWVYEDVKPVVFAEEIVQQKKGKFLVDYKFFCFNGKFGWGFTGQNREVDTRFCVFENDFSIQPVEYIYIKPKRKDMPPKPDSYNEMVIVAEQISKLLDYVRVDFYDTTDGPKIGELTFFSQSGRGSFTKKSYDFKYGEHFKNTKIYNLIQKKKAK